MEEVSVQDVRSGSLQEADEPQKGPRVVLAVHPDIVDGDCLGGEPFADGAGAAQGGRLDRPASGFESDGEPEEVLLGPSDVELCHQKQYFRLSHQAPRV